jgi:hypothetical protein
LGLSLWGTQEGQSQYLKEGLLIKKTEAWENVGGLEHSVSCLVQALKTKN